MTLLGELKVFVKHIAYWIFSFAGFSILFFTFGLKKVAFFGKELFLLLPSENSLTAQVFNQIRKDLLPQNVQPALSL